MTEWLTTGGLPDTLAVIAWGLVVVGSILVSDRCRRRRRQRVEAEQNRYRASGIAVASRPVMRPDREHTTADELRAIFYPEGADDGDL